MKGIMRIGRKKELLVAVTTMTLLLLIFYNFQYLPTKSSGNMIVLQKPSTLLDHQRITKVVTPNVPDIWSLLDYNATMSLSQPYIGNYQCSDQICSEFLSKRDKDNIRQCIKKPCHIIPKCHFMNGTHRAPVALISFPGSGNTWVRGLLEKVTGVCTGAYRVLIY